jgi:sortase B
MAKHARAQQGVLEEQGAQAPLSANPNAASQEGKKPSRGRRIFSNLMIVVGVVLLVVAGVMYFQQQQQYGEQDQINAELASHVVIEPQTDESDEARCPVTVDWEALKAINDEVVGWLYVPDTTINYPVYQGEDNDYYLHHSAEGDWTVGGQLFLDTDNTAPGMQDGQSLIYGHHLRNGTMFEQIAKLDQQENFDAMGNIWYVTETQAYELVPVFMYDTDRDDVDARTVSFATPDELRQFMAERLARALTRRADADAVVGQAEHFLTLSTCVYYSKYERGHGRGLVVCVPVTELPAAS